jgi:hypothetical protein
MADMEAALRTIFGITADSDLSAAFTFGTGPNATMAGTLTLAGDPTENLHVCTKQYVDNNAGGGAETRCTVNLTASQTVNDGNTDAISWDAAHIENGGDCWAIGNPTRLVCPVDGDFLFFGCIPGSAAAADADYHIKIKLNGTTWIYDLIAVAHNEQAGSVEGGASFAFFEPMNASDYIEVFVYAFNANQVIASDAMVSWIKVDG